ncbi:MAG TPA: CBS domain-containing protein [Rubrivivax sp.]|nr:CBS domain-containing protein [Rubrivivax sp.]
MPERTVFEATSMRRVLSVAPSASTYEAARLMTSANCGSVLVIEPGAHQIKGILTEHDVMTRVVAKGLDPGKTTVAMIMTTDPESVRPETRVADAVLIMIEHGFHHLPVVASNGKVLGIFSVRDALPLEVNTAYGLSEFNEQVNDALG